MTLGLVPQATALLLIDPQNWTLGMPIQPHPRHLLVQRAVALMRALRSAGGTIILTRAAFSDGYADMIRTPVDVELRVPEGGIPAASLEFDDTIETIGYDVAITKRQWSAFYGTELDLQLRRRNIATVLIGGVMTNFGVESTARDAWQHNYSTIVVEDLCSSLADDMHRFSVEKILPRVTRVRSLNDVLANLQVA
jgi:nicotinamidase-related amidase